MAQPGGNKREVQHSLPQVELNRRLQRTIILRERKPLYVTHGHYELITNILPAC
jgi:hypothetical protein